MSTKFKREFTYKQRSIEDAKERWKSIGLDEEAIEQFVELCQLVNLDKCSPISDDMETSINRLPTLFIHFLRSFDHLFEGVNNNININNNNSENIIINDSDKDREKEEKPVLS